MGFNRVYRGAIDSVTVDMSDEEEERTSVEGGEEREGGEEEEEEGEEEEGEEEGEEEEEGAEEEVVEEEEEEEVVEEEEEEEEEGPAPRMMVPTPVARKAAGKLPGLAGSRQRIDAATYTQQPSSFEVWCRS